MKAHGEQHGGAWPVRGQPAVNTGGQRRDVGEGDGATQGHVSASGVDLGLRRSGVQPEAHGDVVGERRANPVRRCDPPRVARQPVGPGILRGHEMVRAVGDEVCEVLR